MIARPSTRLVISERPARRDHLHGAWWPHTTDIERELAPMLLRALTRLRPVLGVALNRDEWPGAPLHLQPLSTGSPTISWYGLTEPHLAMLHCGGHSRIALLVLPPDTPEEVAVTAMLMTAAPGNSLTTTETLAIAGARAEPVSPATIDPVGATWRSHPAGAGSHPPAGSAPDEGFTASWR